VIYFSIHKRCKELSSGHLHSVCGPIAWLNIKINKDRQKLLDKFEDTKVGISNCKSKKDWQYNGRKKRDKEWSTKHYTRKLMIEHQKLHCTGMPRNFIWVSI